MGNEHGTRGPSRIEGLLSLHQMSACRCWDLTSPMLYIYERERERGDPFKWDGSKARMEVRIKRWKLFKSTPLFLPLLNWNCGSWITMSFFVSVSRRSKTRSSSSDTHWSSISDQRKMEEKWNERERSLFLFCGKWQSIYFKATVKESWLETSSLSSLLWHLRDKPSKHTIMKRYIFKSLSSALKRPHTDS